MDPALPHDRAGPPAPIAPFLTDAPRPHVHWLWPERLPLGCLSLLIGDPGVGKSLLTADLAARLTTPRPWPDDPAAERPAPADGPALCSESAVHPSIRGFAGRCLAPAGVVFAAPEDRAALPDRLAAAGADAGRISTLDGVRPPFTDDRLALRLPTHVPQLEEAIRAHDHPRLVVLDPLHLLLDDGVYCSPDLQAGLLARLAAVARHTGVAVLAVGHFAKTTARRVFYRIRGSLSVVAAARSILLVTTDPQTPDRRVLTQIKNAYGPLAPPLAFRIVARPACAPATATKNAHESADPHAASRLVRDSNLAPRTAGIPSGAGCAAPERSTPLPDSSNVAQIATIAAPRLEWDDPTRPDWRLATGVLDLSPESFSALSEACDWLTDFLSAGPRPAREVLTAARAAGIPRSTLFRAKRLLQIPSRRTGPTWTWLPPPAI